MIFWLNNPFDALPLEGGRPMRYWLLARELVRSGHEVVWWSSDFHHLEKRRRVLPPVYTHEGIQVRLVPSLCYKRNISIKRWCSHIRYAKEWKNLAERALASGELHKPHALVISMPPLGLHAPARGICDSTGAKFIVDVQDLWPETFYVACPGLPLRLKKALLAPLRRMARAEYGGADLLTAVSGAYVEFARKSGCGCEASVFPLGSDDQGYEPRECGDDPDGELSLVYIGNLGESYDLGTVINGVKSLTRAGLRVRLRIAGDGPMAGFVKQAAAEAGGSPVEYCGYLAAEELAELLSSADIGVVPMNPGSMVAFPNKLVDYAAGGLAIVSSLKGECRGMLEDYGCGLFYEFGDAESFAQAVRRYYGDRPLLAAHRRSARKLFEAKFDAAGIYPAMARWIAGVIAATEPPPPRLRRPW